MRVFLSGATGFLGRALVLALRNGGHTVVAWVRDPARARDLLGAEAELLPMQSGDGNLAPALAGCDAVVNLAGEPILSRWSATRRAALRASRVDLTARLVRAHGASARRPTVLLSGSAVGFYGEGGDEFLSETSGRGQGFLAELCVEWETAARAAEPLGTRVVLLRT
ncbi:MAG: NAD-dependent epimerase/dehydratase family protein, partial [Planctomycetota bacterium]